MANGGGAILRLEDDHAFLLSILDSVALQIAAPAVLASHRRCAGGGADGRAI